MLNRKSANEFYTLHSSLKLSLNATISVTTSKTLYLVNRNQVEVMGIVCFKAEAATANSKASA